MANLANLANIAAATSAGYSETVLDRGSNYGADRFTVTLEKHLVGEPGGSSGAPWRAYGQGSTQAAAETQALAALNAQRAHLYAGTGAHGGTLTTDQHLANCSPRANNGSRR
jgi:hypothetical protein